MSLLLALVIVSISSCSRTVEQRSPATAPEAPDDVLRSRLEAVQGCCKDVKVVVDFTIAVTGTAASVASTPEELENLCALVAAEAEYVYGNEKTIEVSLNTPNGTPACSLATEPSPPSTVEEEKPSATRPPSLPPSQEDLEEGP